MGALTHRVLVLVFVTLCFFVQYAAQNMVAPFFPGSSAGKAIGQHAVGAVFSAYPFATCLAIPLPPLVQAHVGTRKMTALGVLLSAASSIIFGVVPMLLSTASSAALGVALFATRVAAGVGCALCETGAFTLAGIHFEQHTGKMNAYIQTMIGLGSILGVAVGGLLYEAGAHTPFGAFLFPFVIIGMLQLSSLPFLLMLPCDNAQRAAEADVSSKLPAQAESAATSVRIPIQQHLSPRVVVTTFSVFMSAFWVEAPLPIVEPHFTRPPYRLSVAGTGYVFSTMSCTYMLATMPIGIFVDHAISLPLPRATRRLKLMMASGTVLSAVSYFILGPLSATSPAHLALPVSIGGFLLFGLAASLLIVPSVPDMRLGTEGDEVATAALSALWNGVYSAGGAVGAIASSAIYKGAGWGFLCHVMTGGAAAVAGLLLVFVLFLGNGDSCWRQPCDASLPEEDASLLDVPRGSPR